MIPDDFRHRRAKLGKGRRKKLLVSELRMCEYMITHAIIAHVAGSEEGATKRAEAEAEKAKIVEELLLITHEATDVLHSRGKKQLKA